MQSIQSNYQAQYEKEFPVIEKQECQNCAADYSPMVEGSMWLCGKCDKNTVYRSSPDTEERYSSRFHQDAHGS